MPPDGYVPDVVTRIVNVHWAGGLAVEFGDKDQAPDELHPEPPPEVRQ